MAFSSSESALLRENLRKTCSSRLRKATPTTSAACALWVRLRRLRFVWCGLRLRGATGAIKERCLLYQCSSHLLTLSILTHEIQCCTYRERATKHARMQSALRALASRSHAFSGEEKAWGIAYTPLVPQECLVETAKRNVA